MINANPSCNVEEGITVPCCTNLIPTRLFATLQGDGVTIELNYVGVKNVGHQGLLLNKHTWEGSGVSNCGDSITQMQLFCNDDPPGSGTWGIYYADPSDEGGGSGVPISCNPFRLEFFEQSIEVCYIGDKWIITE